MNIAYFKDWDSLYIERLPENATQAWEISPVQYTPQPVLPTKE